MAWLVVKMLAALLGGALLLAVLYVAAIRVRKSNTFVLRGDLEILAASGPMNSGEMASAVCGTPVDFLGAPDTPFPSEALPQAKLLSWRPFFPMEGSAAARVVGVGVSRASGKAVTGPCEATITFRYRCRWEDNGRSVNLGSYFVGTPTIVRSR